MTELSPADVLLRLARGEKLDRADLRGVNLARATLSGASLGRADLEGADLRGADLTGANLTNASLREANLSDANLREAKLESADLERANLQRAVLIGADLTRANLEGANLGDANLAGARMRRSQLADANLAGADLRDATRMHADLAGAVLERVKAAGADFNNANLRGALLVDGNFTRASFNDASLIEVKARAAKLGGAALVKADLSRADLSETDFRLADLRRARLTGATLRGARLTGAKVAGLIGTGAALDAGLEAAFLDPSPEGDGAARPSEGEIPFLLSGFVAGEIGGAKNRRYFGRGDILRDATLAFDGGAHVEVDSLFENCVITLGPGAELVIGRAGVLAGCQINGSGDVTVHGHFFQRRSPGIVGVRTLRVTSQGALVASVEQHEATTRFAFEKGSRLRLRIARHGAHDTGQDRNKDKETNSDDRRPRRRHNRAKLGV